MSSTWTARTKFGWGLMLLGCLLLVLFSARYFTLNPEVYFERQRDVYEAKILALMVHISGMTVAALLGPFQFLRGLRDRHRGLHRTMGKVYLTGALVGATGGIYMSQYSASGAVSGVAFALLALGVLTTGGMAFARIKAGKVREHQQWMTRNFALILAAVTLRIYAAPLEAIFGEYTGYAIVAWACWVPNLAVAEWMIRRGWQGGQRGVTANLAPA